MHWINAALLPFQHNRWKILFSYCGLMVAGLLLYALVVGGGFLFIVGAKPMALMMAVLPCCLLAMLALCLGLGYTWEVLAELIEDPTVGGLPNLEEWPRYILEGAQLLLFYGLLGIFLTTTTLLLYPVGLLIPLLGMAFYPLLVAPVVYSIRDKSFLGLMDGALEGLRLLQQDYLNLWLEMTLYTVLIGGLCYPLALCMFGVTGIGLLLIPALCAAFGLGQCLVLANVQESSPIIEADYVNPFASPVVQPGTTAIQLQVQATLPSQDYLERPPHWPRHT